MVRELSILLVEDDPVLCQQTMRYVDGLDDVTLVGVTNNSEQALTLIQSHLPDAVILDLELHFGSGNGLLLLQNMRQCDLPKIPYILITTNNSSLVTYESARQLGADFILSKHQRDYTPEGAVDFLRMMKDVIQNRPAPSSNSSSETVESPELQNKRIMRRICAELDLIGISSKAVGYQYLVDAIRLVMGQPTHNLCSVIAEKYGKTESSVERAMHNAIARAWRTTPIDELLRLYTARISSERGVPTLTEFIYYYDGAPILVGVCRICGGDDTDHQHSGQQSAPKTPVSFHG